MDLYYLLVQMSDEFYPLLEAHGNTIKLSGDENLTVYGDGEKVGAGVQQYSEKRHRLQLCRYRNHRDGITNGAGSSNCDWQPW